MSSVNKRGAALMIAIVAAVVVMLAATLLIGVTRRMIDSYTHRLYEAQISLSEASAADALAGLLQEQGTAAGNGSHVFELAGVTTEFSLVETGSAPIRRGFLPIDNPQKTLIVPVGGHIVTVEQPSEDLPARVGFFSGLNMRQTAVFEIGTDLLPVAGTPVTLDGRDGVLIVFEEDGSSLLVAVSSEGVLTQLPVDASVCSTASHLSAAEGADGSPLLVVSDGSNRGVLYNCNTGDEEHVSSPVGTSPSFFPDGRLFGSVSDRNSFGLARVKDVFGGDFNSDGRGDLAFATTFSLSVCSGSTGELFTARPGGVLIAWGSVKGRTGLCGMWLMPNGEQKWLRLGYRGFTEFSPGLNYTLGWQGRFFGRGNTLAGVVNDTVFVASSSGYLRELFSGLVFNGDADWGDDDFFRVTADGLEVCFNPVNGEGVSLTFSSENRYRGEKAAGETHVFSVYDAGGERRVFHTIGGGEL